MKLVEGFLQGREEKMGCGEHPGRFCTVEQLLGPASCRLCDALGVSLLQRGVLGKWMAPFYLICVAAGNNC